MEIYRVHSHSQKTTGKPFYGRRWFLRWTGCNAGLLRLRKKVDGQKQKPSYTFLQNHSNAKLLAVFRVTNNKGGKRPELIISFGDIRPITKCSIKSQNKRLSNKTIAQGLYPEKEWEEASVEHPCDAWQGDANAV